MRIPRIRGLIDRRLLVNYRVDPNVLERLLPPPFQPQLVGGWGIAGVCLIRLKQLRPWFAPRWLGIGSENAAHRIAVCWSEGSRRRTGVFIPRRDTSSRWNHLAGGRVFPGVHQLADFRVQEGDGGYRIRVCSADGSSFEFAGKVGARFPEDSVFSSVEDASRFFHGGSIGYSPSGRGASVEGLELCCDVWGIEPVTVTRLRSSYFDDPQRFPPGSIRLDCVLAMHNIPHAWRVAGPPASACSIAPQPLRTANLDCGSDVRATC